MLGDEGRFVFHFKWSSNVLHIEPQQGSPILGDMATRTRSSQSPAGGSWAAGSHRGGPGGGPVPTFVESWAQQSWALRILRAFLGATFVYAGVQKFLDPNFFHSGTPDYIGSQLRAFAIGSPIRPVLLVAAHVPVLTGIGVALVEIAVGLGTLLGIAPVLFAASGLAVSLVLFLSATWHVHPYFLGSDSMYAVAWTALLVGMVETQRRIARTLASTGSRRQRSAAFQTDPGRREFLRGALVGVGTLLLAGVASVVSGKTSSARASLGPRTSAGTTPVPRPTRTHHARLSTAGPVPSTIAPPVQGTPVASLDRLPVGGAIGFTAPTGNTPCVLLRPSQDHVVAYSRVCTHAGCLVGYDPGSKILVCPCHGAEFDPSRGAEVVGGPAPFPLPSVPVAIDHAAGEVVVTS
jgi:thiosulfate dehydrogenase (quinone) large subunit